MTRSAIALLLATTGLAGCASGANHVAEQWGKTIADYDLVPIFPPTEDVMPGDALLIGIDASTASDDAQNGWKLRLGQFPPEKLFKLLADNYAARLTITPPPPVKSTTTATTADADPSPPALIADPPKVSPASGDRMSKGSFPMRVLALPNVVVASDLSADLAGGGGIGGAVVNAFVGGAAHTDVSLTLSDLVEYHVDGATVLREMHKNQAGFLDQYLTAPDLVDFVAQKNHALVGDLCAANFAPLDAAHIQLYLVNEVVYARTINYIFNDSKTIAAQLAANFAPAGATPAAGPAGAAAPVIPAATGAATAANIQGAQTALESMAKQYTNANPGIAAHFSFGTTGKLTLSVTSARPLAVGMSAGLTYFVSDIVRTYGLLSGVPTRVPPGLPADQIKSAIDLNNVNTQVASRCKFYGFDGSRLQTAVTTDPTATPSNYQRVQNKFPRGVTLR